MNTTIISSIRQIDKQFVRLSVGDDGTLVLSMGNEFTLIGDLADWAYLLGHLTDLFEDVLEQDQ